MHIETVDLRRAAISPAVKHFKRRRTANCYWYICRSWIRICGTKRSENFGIHTPHMVGQSEVPSPPPPPPLRWPQ